VLLHEDFRHYSALVELLLSEEDGAIFCLGAYAGAVQEAELGRITADYTIELARVLRGTTPARCSHFCADAARARRDELACLRTLQGGG
jgi:hypothetical protein